ncbi:MAG TPA: 3'-5' exonuclease [Alphaproteobacteria bacterium]|nr:3'-5' exonuclease [Alphaproteobacteria bacterium]
MGKILWADTETGGFDPTNNPLLELAAIVEIDNEIIDEFVIQFRPKKGKIIHPKALEVNGKTEEEINKYPPTELSVLGFKRKLEQHVNKFNKDDKFILAGYNVGFDAGFIRNTFLETGDNFYGSYFFSCNLDVYSEVAKMIVRTGLRLPNYKLGTVCDAFKIPINTHDAKSDITATRNLFYKLQECQEKTKNT